MVRTIILEVMRARAGEWCRPQALADHAFIGLGEVEKAVDNLRQSGYEIENRPHLGYRLLATTSRLIPYEISRGLGTSTIGRKILALDRTTSTNDVAWTQASAGAADGTVICAEEQAAGRGRMGRQWLCPSGKGILASVILRPELDVAKRSVLTVMAAVATARAIQECYHLPALIRWPNDIIIRDRKVGGILVEARTLASGATFVAGLGLNASMQTTDIPADLRGSATSLAIETGREIDRIEFARFLLRSLDRWYHAVKRGEYGPIAEDWRHLSSTLGQRVALTDGSEEYHGRVLDLTLEDGLILRLDSGVTRVFPPAHVTLKQQGGTMP